MKRKQLINIICLLLIVVFTGCKQSGINTEKLYNINNKIIEYFENNDIQTYSNYSYNYVDEENKIIVVGLINNSKEQQNKFRKDIADSKYIKFEKGGTDEIDREELTNIQNKIIDRVLLSKKDYSNFFSCFVDEKNKTIIIGLANDNTEPQKWFKENVINYKNMKFVKESFAWNYQDEIYFYVENVINQDISYDTKFDNYFEIDNRSIYKENTIEEFYIVSKDKRKETLKQYLSNLNRNFDTTIKIITDKLEKQETLKDGGTIIYKSKDKDISMIICNTLAGNKDVYIGNYSIEYQQNMCK